MRTRGITIEGSDLHRLTSCVTLEFIPLYVSETEDYWVFAREDYYFRTTSNLLTALIVHFQSDSRCRVEVIAGGGKEGFPIPLSLFSEGEAKRTTVSYLEDLCKEHSWRFLPDESSDRAVLEGEARQRAAKKDREDEIEVRRWDRACPSCGHPTNFQTKEGLRQSEETPWRLLCEKCGAEIQADDLI